MGRVGMTKPVLLVVSYAGIRAINRAVYMLMQEQAEVSLVVPLEITASSGLVVSLEPPMAGEGHILGHKVAGRNPRTLTFRGLARTLRLVRPNVILYEGDPASRLAWQLADWASGNEARLICQTYDNVDRRWSAGAGRPLVTRMRNLMVSTASKLMMKRIQALLVVNRAGEDAFAKLGYGNVIRIPLGYDPAVFFADKALRDATRERLTIRSDEKVVGYFGRMVRQKGVHLLIESLAQLQHLPWRLLLDDDFDPQDSYANEIRMLISGYGLKNRVLFFEANHREIASYMRSADISVAPSLTTPFFTEQYGRAVQESMACGCVTLVSDSGHLPDLVNDPELIFPEGSVEKLVETLRYAILNDDWRKVKSQQLSRRAESHFTIRHQANLMISLISQRR